MIMLASTCVAFRTTKPLGQTSRFLLTAYMAAWPNDELTRDSFVATYLARFIETSSQNSPEDQAAENIPQSQEWAKFERPARSCKG